MTSAAITKALTAIATPINQALDMYAVLCPAAGGTSCAASFGYPSGGVGQHECRS
jgi:hypothetical protein